MGRHQRSAVPATPRQRRASELLGVAIGVGIIAAVWAIAVDSAPQVHADEVPQAPEAVEPTRSTTPVGGPLDRIFYFDDVVPYDEGKEPGLLLVDERTRSTGSSVTRANRPPEETISPTPTPTPTPAPPPAPAPAPNDPLTDDGTFGDGCEQPGTPERCDPDTDDPLTDDGEFGDGCETPGTPERCDPVVGLPPVIVEEPAEEETPVDEVEVVEPVTEVAG